MLTVPKHVYEFIERIQDELNEQKKRYPNDKNINSYIHEIKELRRLLEIESLSTEENYSKVFEIITQIIGMLSYLPATPRRRVYHEIVIDSKLASFIDQCSRFNLKRKKGKKEIEQLIKNSKLESINKGIAITVFKCINDENEWNKLLEDEDESKSKIRFHFVDKNSNEFLRIYHVQSKIELENLAKEVKCELISKGKFRKYKNAFYVWFRDGGTTETYYIYILD